MAQKSRLDRLLNLLDTGSVAMRSVAAKQIGELAKYHHDEQPFVVAKVSTFLRSKCWETRAAAGEAIHAIAQLVPTFEQVHATANRQVVKKEEEPLVQLPEDFDNKLSFSNFDINKVLSFGTTLLASGDDSETEEQMISKMNDLEKLIYQKRKLRSILGLEGPVNRPLKQITEDMDEEILEEKYPSLNGIMGDFADIVSMTASEKRKSNKRKRDAKKQKKAALKSQQEHITIDGGSVKKKKIENDSATYGQSYEEGFDESIPLKDEKHWAFYWLAEKLRLDLFDSRWEVRHGAAIGLRELMRDHAKSAGKSVSCKTVEELNAANQDYLEDICIRILCIFALDQFSDFISDQVIMPVRETCAQILAIVAQHISTTTIRNIVQCLISLMRSDNWQTRRGGLLGLKYTIAVRLSDIDVLLPIILPAIMSAIDDESDDVIAIAAETFLPIIEHVLRLAPKEIKHLHTKLWDILLNLDDLSSATASVMSLLAKIHTLALNGSGSTLLTSNNLIELVPRLWPFFRHNLLIIRKSAVETIRNLINGSKDSSQWLDRILKDLMSYVFQNIILETESNLIELSLSLWDLCLQKLPIASLTSIANVSFVNWVRLLSTPLGTKMDPNLMTLPSQIRDVLQSTAPKASHSQKGERKKKSAVTTSDTQDEHRSFAMRMMIDNEEDMALMRINGSRALSKLAAVCSVSNPMPIFFTTVQQLLDSEWAVHKKVAAFLIQELYMHGAYSAKLPKEIENRLLSIVMNQQFSYIEMQHVYSTLLSDSHSLLEIYSASNFDVSPYYTTDSITKQAVINNLSLEDASDIATRIYDFCMTLVTDVTIRNELESRRNRVLSSIERYTSTTVSLHSEVMACVSSAIVHSGILPDIIDPIVYALMDSVSKESSSPTLQERSAYTLATLVYLCSTRNPCPSHHILSNLCELLCSTIPPVVLKPENEGTSKKSKSNSKKKQIDDITETKTKEQVAHRGAVLTLQFIAQKFGIQLFESLPNLWAITGQVISQFNLLSVESSAETTIQNEQTVINGLHIITTIASSIDSNLHSVLEQLFDSIVSQVPFSNERTIPYIALAIATLCTVITSRAMKIIIEKLFPMLADPKNYNARRGSVSVIYKIITTLDLDILPYIVFFVVPLLKRMSDQDQVTRELAANCFGVIIKILPLERSAKSVVGFEESREKERKFIEQLLDNSKVEPFELPIKINAELRQYQKDGISWMAFLNKYNLHGILCDDMGLGKTLQTICIVASDIEIRKRLYEQTKAAEYIHLPSLVVCPPTLVGHWNHEIEKFCPQLSVIQYSGSIQQRKLLRERFSSSDVTVMSYDVLRNDIDKIMQVQSCWNYCILDEGHIIKNKATQITKAVKMINANHRLILSGTPIQNNVLELWSLFDFLMPGFLGTEKEFNNRYGKPILASKDAKANSKEQAEGTLAMEALHRQVLPFLLRRVKEDVLQDLPEKIIQDYYCELSSLQAQLYESFYKSQVHEEIAETLEHIEQEGIQSIENAANKQHVFQALQYLRKLCNHPCLVLNPEHPQYHKITAELEQQGKSIQDISLSPKMLALKQLLLDCGIGLNATSNEQIDFVSQHRVLIFCQLKSVLDIIEHELFRNHMPFVSYMRLDGSVEQSKRFAIVHKFNSDPSIDVLLLTTHVGGLGLNLTGADTVIFVEHDWNPSADLQAMDRAHRIGQKKVVNVYRIITKDTLEERIMGLQRFKLNISKAVINTENSSTRTMNTDQLVNLFQLSDKTPSSSSINAIDVTDEQIEKQYEEFDLSSFLQKLK